MLLQGNIQGKNPRSHTEVPLRLHQTAKTLVQRPQMMKEELATSVISQRNSLYLHGIAHLLVKNKMLAVLGCPGPREEQVTVSVLKGAEFNPFNFG